MIPSVFLNHNGTTFDTDAGLILDLDLLELQYMEPLTVRNLDDEGGGLAVSPKRSILFAVKIQRD